MRASPWAFLLLTAAFPAVISIKAPVSAPISRRSAVAAAVGGVSLPILAAPKPASAFIGVLTSLGMKGAAQKQKACYDALECASDVPYYDITCERGDAECIARKRRLANEALRGGPGFEVIALFAIALLSGPLTAVARAIRTAIRRMQ